MHSSFRIIGCQETAAVSNQVASKSILVLLANTYSVLDMEETQLHEVEQTTSSSSAATAAPLRDNFPSEISGLQVVARALSTSMQATMSTTMEDFFNPTD